MPTVPEGEPLQPGRRRLLRQLGAGIAVVTVPIVTPGCAALPVLDAPPPAEPLVDWLGLDSPGLAGVLAQLGSQGGDFGEVYVQHARRTRLVLADGELAAPRRDIELGAGLRVSANGHSGFVATTDLAPDSLEAAARAAAASLAGGPRAAPAVAGLSRSPSRYPLAVPWGDVADARRRAILERADSLVRAADPAVVAVTVDWRDSDERILVATLDGRVVEDRRPLATLAVQVRARRGDITQSGFASFSARDGIARFDEAQIAAVATLAVERALGRFDARRPPAGELPVVLAAGSGGILLHETVGHCFEGDIGPATGARPGDRLAGGAVTLVDDAGLAHLRGALNVDDEGVDAGRTVLLEGGVLKGWLHDRASALRQGAGPTGSGRRETFRDQPLPRMTCTYLADGTEPPEALFEDIELGILAETFAGGTADPAGGDFRFAVRNGWLIERGRKTVPIRDATLAGTGRALLAGIDRVANDGRFDPGGWTCGKRGQRLPVSTGMPTVRVRSLGVGPGDATA